MARKQSEFVEYLLSFYGKEGIYGPLNPNPIFRPAMSKKEAVLAADIVGAGKDFDGDSFDREKARDLVLSWRDKGKRAHATKKDDGDVTDAQIRALRREAASAGDHAQALLCDLALGDVVLDEDTTIDSLRIASFLSPRDKQQISEMDPDDYRAACERAIEAGRG